MKVILHGTGSVLVYIIDCSSPMMLCSLNTIVET